MKETDCISTSDDRAPTGLQAHHAQRVRDSEARHGVAESWAGSQETCICPGLGVLYLPFSGSHFVHL